MNPMWSAAFEAARCNRTVSGQAFESVCDPLLRCRHPQQEHFALADGEVTGLR